MDAALAAFVDQFKQTADAIVDPWFVVDKDRSIVEFNRAFFSMLPRNVARGLKGKKAPDVITLKFPTDEDIVLTAWRESRHVRLDEIKGHVAGAEAEELRFILSAVPIKDSSGNPVGALVILRNVTDEAMVQVKYQEMLETEARERDRLSQQIRTRTKELLDTNQALLRVQKELLAFKKGLMI